MIDKTTHPNSSFGRAGPKVKGKHFEGDVDQVFIVIRYGQEYSYVATLGVHWRAFTTGHERKFTCLVVAIKISDTFI
jgi:hypothetical protein